MKTLPALLAIALFSICATGCGGAGKGVGSAPQAHSSASSAPTTRVSTGTTSTGAGTSAQIPAYGQKASAQDRRAVTALVRSYYAAAAADDGATACSLLFPTLARVVPEDYGKPPGPAYSRGKTCATVMSKIFKHVPGGASDLAATEVTNVRIYRNQGVAELRSPAMPKGEITVERHGKSWRIGALIGRATA